MDAMNIGALARATGTRASAIRYYERIGLLPPAVRVCGWRQFDAGAVDYIKVIRSAQDLGFSLEEIRTLLYGYPQDMPPSERWKDLARKKLPEIEDLIRRAAAMKRLLEAGLDCNCAQIADCFLEDCSS